MNWDKLVVEQPPVKNLVITPFGFVCDVCGKSIAEGQRSLQRHMREHKISVTNEGYSNAVKAICSLQRSIRSDWSLVAKYLTGRKINGFSCHCVIGFGHRHVAKRHIDGGHCGATDLIEEELHEAVGGNAISLRAFKLHLFSDKKCSGLRFQRNRKTIPSDNPTCVEGTVNDTSETIAPYMRVDELTSVDVYYEMVYGYIAQFKKQATFQDSMVRSVHLWNLPVNKDDKEILVAKKLCSDWLTNHARMHVSRTPANIRASLLVFESATLLDTTQNSTFCFRLNTLIILREAQKMVRFLLPTQYIDHPS